MSEVQSEMDVLLGLHFVGPLTMPGKPKKESPAQGRAGTSSKRRIKSFAP